MFLCVASRDVILFSYLLTLSAERLSFTLPLSQSSLQVKCLLHILVKSVEFTLSPFHVLVILLHVQLQPAIQFGLVNKFALNNIPFCR